MKIARWEVGSEFDAALLARLGAAMKQLGFQVAEDWSGMAGSQDIAHWTCSSPDGELIVESETYVGLIVSGDEALIDRVRQVFADIA